MILDPNIQVALYLKLAQIRRTSNPNITYDNIESVLYYDIWKREIPKSLSVAINDIMSLTIETIIMFLSKQAIVDGYHASLDDFTDMFEN